MKRTLSLLVALALVFTMVPAVFATDVKDSIDMDELVPGTQLNPETAEIGQEYTTTWDEHYYIITPADAGKLQFTVENGTVAVQNVEVAEDGTYAVEASVEYTVVVTGAGATWSATYIAPHVHAAATYTDNGDGTHDGICECKEVVVDNEAHADTDSNGVCDSCSATLACKHTTVAYTDNGNGTHDGVCSACGETVVDNEAHADANSDRACDSCGLAFDSRLVFSGNADLLLGDKIQASFKVSIKNVKSTYSRFFVECKMDGKDPVQVDVSLESGTNTRYFFYTVLASEMTENVIVTFCGVKDDVVYRGQTLNWTLCDAVMAKLNSWMPTYESNEIDAKKCDMLVNMLQYGTEAQKKFNSTNTNYPTNKLTPEMAALIKTTTPEMNDAPTIDQTGMVGTYSLDGLMLVEKIELYVQFKIKKADFSALEDYTVQIELEGREAPEVINFATVTGSNTKTLTAYIGFVKSNEMRKTMKITLMKDGVAQSKTITRSADMIVKSKLSAYPTLAPAVMNFADCAEAYFG